MKKSVLLAALSLCLFVSACGKISIGDTSSGDKTSIEDTSSSNQQPSKSESIEQATSNVTEESKQEVVPTKFNYETALLAVIGEDYLKDKALMRVEDREICGYTCAVFKVGINSEELFTTIDWFAVDSEGKVYCYDVVMDEWSEYKETTAIDYVQIDNCIYMLNEYLRGEFSAEYRDMPDEIKQAIFENENSIDGIPAKLIGIKEEVPAGYCTDPFARYYYPVYNFIDFENVTNHFSEYFTVDAMEEVENLLSYNFLDFEDTLYLVRGGQGYGAVTLDFDSVDYSCLEDEYIVLIDELLFGEKYGEYKLKFSCEDGQWKINSFEEMIDK